MQPIGVQSTPPIMLWPTYVTPEGVKVYCVPSGYVGVDGMYFVVGPNGDVSGLTPMATWRS